MNKHLSIELENEIKEKLKNWKQIIARYQVPNAKKAILQMTTSFGPYLILWVIMYLSMDWSIWITIFLGLVNSFFLVRIFIIQHDCGHQSYFRSKSLNTIVGTICSLFSSLPFRYWARVHNHHHGHTGQLEERDIGDINFLTIKEYSTLSNFGKFKYRLLRIPIVTFFIAPFYYFTVANRLTLFFRNQPWWIKVKNSQIRNNLLIVCIYGVLGWLLGWQKFLFIQLFTIFAFSIIAFWFFYVQHQHEDGYQRWKKDWSFLLSSIRGASYYKLPKTWQWLTGNIGIHHIHHLSSLIPNYNLEQCMKENPILSKYAVKITFLESLLTVKNKLWSEDLQKMVSWTEYRQLRQLGVV